MSNIRHYEVDWENKVCFTLVIDCDIWGRNDLLKYFNNIKEVIFYYPDEQTIAKYISYEKELSIYDKQQTLTRLFIKHISSHLIPYGFHDLSEIEITEKVNKVYPYLPLLDGSKGIKIENLSTHEITEGEILVYEFTDEE